jgi:hypothetical protein
MLFSSSTIQHRHTRRNAEYKLVNFTHIIVTATRPSLAPQHCQIQSYIQLHSGPRQYSRRCSITRTDKSVSTLLQEISPRNSRLKYKDAVFQEDVETMFHTHTNSSYHSLLDEPQLMNCFLLHPIFDDEDRYPLDYRTIRQYQAQINYFLYLSHVGMTRLQNTMKTHFYHPKLEERIRHIVGKCDPCQKYKSGRCAYADLPPRCDYPEPLSNPHGTCQWHSYHSSQCSHYRTHQRPTPQTVSDLIPIRLPLVKESVVCHE